MQLTRRDFLTLLGVGALLTTGLPPVKANNQRVAVIGAGMAGLAAARRLKMAGYDVVVIEARERVGGRILSSYDLAPYPIELGAEFIHGDNVPTWDLLKAFDLDNTLDALKIYANLGFYENGRLLRFPNWAQLTAVELLNEIEDELEWDEATDLSLAEWLETEIPPVLNNIMASETGADVDALGVQGLLEATYARDGDGDFRLVAGYTRLIEAMAADLDIRLNHVVQRVEYGTNRATVITAQASFEADAVVVTLPLGVLQAGDVVFEPPLPPAKQRAIHGLGAGMVNKLILKFDAPFWDNQLEAIATDLASQVWWRPGWGRSQEVPILTALIGGRSGANFSQMDEVAAIMAGLDDLSQMFAIEYLPARLVEGHFINWGTDPYSKMGYSYVPVGAAGMRQVLAEAVNKVLFFAGEATTATHPATVHGALLSGWRAAQEIQRR